MQVSAIAGIGMGSSSGCGAAAAAGSALPLGKTAKNLAAFVMIDSFLDAQAQRLSHKPGVATIYGVNNAGGQTAINTLIMDALAMSNFMAVA